MPTKQYVKVTLVKSISGRSVKHVACIRGLGLTGKMHQSRVDLKTRENMGMVNKVAYLLRVEDVAVEK